MTMFGMLRLRNGPTAGEPSGTDSGFRSHTNSSSPWAHSPLSFVTLGVSHIVSFRSSMLSRIPVVVQYIMPMTSGFACFAPSMSLRCFFSFCDSFLNGFVTDVPPFP